MSLNLRPFFLFIGSAHVFAGLYAAAEGLQVAAWSAGCAVFYIGLAFLPVDKP